MKLIYEQTILEGVFIIKGNISKDERGSFKELYNFENYEKFGIKNKFVQDNYSRSIKNTIRGLHGQKKNPQGKLVSCLRGTALDVIIDIEPKSKTFCKYVTVEISDSNNYQVWIPPQYLHGFCALTEIVDIFYKCTDFYYPDDQTGLIWNDPDISIPWPIKDPILSNKDRNLPSLKNYLNFK